MKNKFILFYSSVLLISCAPETKVTKAVSWDLARASYLRSIQNANQYIDSLLIVEPNDPKAKLLFIQLRRQFKKAEPYASYLNPEVGHRANGPALPLYKEDTGKIMRPFGLQKIEESIYDGNTSKEQFQVELKLTKGLLGNLEHNIADKPLNPQRFFIAVQQQLLRIISHSISGFDTPVSHLGISESAISLNHLKELYGFTLADAIKRKNSTLHSTFLELIDRAVVYLNTNTDFESFDRYSFIRDYFNPITRSWKNIRDQSGLWTNVDNKPFNFDAPTFFEDASFNTLFFTPPVDRPITDTKIALGEKLFFEPRLSQSRNMACVSCHNPEKAYADGLVFNTDNAGKSLDRNTPTLLNTIYQQNFFWDGRSPTLADQISNVFTNDREFNTVVHQFSDDILQDSLYTTLLRKVYPNTALKNIHIVKAISAYVGTLNTFNSKFDKNMRGEESTFTKEEQLGMNLFMGKALCATCHFMPLTNGTVPPFYTETEKEVIGVPETKQNKKLDGDFGFYWRYGEELHRGMFKTPSVRNAELTAPYMHNGVYATLEEVMDFYNQGGGAGMGFVLERQTLPFDALNLSDSEQKALVAFVKTLTDAEVKAL